MGFRVTTLNPKPKPSTAQESRNPAPEAQNPKPEASKPSALSPWCPSSCHLPRQILRPSYLTRGFGVCEGLGGLGVCGFRGLEFMRFRVSGYMWSYAHHQHVPGPHETLFPSSVMVVVVRMEGFRGLGLKPCSQICYT